MTKLPWLSHVSKGVGARNLPDVRDGGESEDPLGAVVGTDTNGLVVARATKLTEVRQETTDDN